MKKEKVGEEKEQGATPLFVELLCHLCLCFCCHLISSANQPVSRLVETGLRIKKNVQVVLEKLLQPSNGTLLRQTTGT